MFAIREIISFLHVQDQILAVSLNITSRQEKQKWKQQQCVMCQDDIEPTIYCSISNIRACNIAQCHLLGLLRSSVATEHITQVMSLFVEIIHSSGWNWEGVSIWYVNKICSIEKSWLWKVDYKSPAFIRNTWQEIDISIPHYISVPAIYTCLLVSNCITL